MDSSSTCYLSIIIATLVRKDRERVCEGEREWGLGVF